MRFTKNAKKIDVVMGTRPEAIKMAPVVRELRKRGKFSVRVISTGQHTDMLRQALSFFGLSPDADLAIMKRVQSLDYITASVITGVGELFDSGRPDAVLVHGDTTTTFAASLAAFHRKIPIGHVEAGLRSFDMSLPFPEEMNRTLTDRIARWLFAPTEHAASNLRRERPGEKSLYVTGNTVIDALHSALDIVGDTASPALAGLEGSPFILMTAHRRESWGEAMERICLALSEILRRHGCMRALVPMHRNPAVRDTMKKILGDNDRVILRDPLDYPDFVRALKHCKIILSDSGGVQEEASALGKPVIVLRDVTERPEAVESGTAVVAGTSTENIVSIADRLLSDEGEYRRAEEKKNKNPFGDGAASARIADILERQNHGAPPRTPQGDLVPLTPY
ncbi:MAG: UDP-N-acetylglucosamine 2-epimerase (non-hydrolyzing) [Synergistaceae bacterium]|jgi:UDP-N-acetylglucosamine 2-epimerase (non-hydrolysing)|nr:UDP-N-acetylglucosamine 2-epimerase (non-hydrolyzing) [Synergistaceae bacterium]